MNVPMWDADKIRAKTVTIDAHSILFRTIHISKCRKSYMSLRAVSFRALNDFI